MPQQHPGHTRCAGSNKRQSESASIVGWLRKGVRRLQARAANIFILRRGPKDYKLLVAQRDARIGPRSA